MKGELQNFQVLGGSGNYLKVCILIIHTHMLCLPPIPPSPVCVCVGGRAAVSFTSCCNSKAVCKVNSLSQKGIQCGCGGMRKQ